MTKKYLVNYVTYSGRNRSDSFFAEDKDMASSLCYKADNGGYGDEDCWQVTSVEEMGTMKLWSIKYTAANGEYMDISQCAESWDRAVGLLYASITLSVEQKPKSILDIISVEETQ